MRYEANRMAARPPSDGRAKRAALVSADLQKERYQALAREARREAAARECRVDLRLI